MTEKERIEREVEKTLQCFDTIERVEPRPFFFTRLKAGISSLEAEKTRSAQRGKSFGSLRPALLSVLILLNLFSAIAIFRGSTTSVTERSEYLAAFAEEYAFSQEAEDLLSFVN